MKSIIISTLLLAILNAQAQIGVGTNNPTAELEILAPANGKPSIELNPQSAPTGTATGQLSVIGDKLYAYDDIRGKWLSVEYTLLNYGLLGPADNQDLEFVGDIELSGPRMPFDGTIVYITMNASGGQPNKEVQIHKNNVPIPDNINPNQDGFLELDLYSYSNTLYNLDFNAGDYFQVDVTDTGIAVQDLSVLIKVKWRK